MKVKLIDFGGRMPTRGHYNDAGADIYCDKDYSIYPGEIISIPAGFGLELPDGYAGFVFSRSSLSAKGLVCELPPIDAGYRGEIHAIVSNISNSPKLLSKGDRIGQLVILPVIMADFVTDLGAERKTGAFGSSGR